MPFYETQFTPAEHLDEDPMNQWLLATAEHGLPQFFRIPLLRRRGQWIAPLPACAWKLTATSLDAFEELQLRSAAETRRRDDTGSYGFVRSRDVVLGEGQDGIKRWFYRDSALSSLTPYLAVPQLATALIRRLHAQEDPRKLSQVRVKSERYAVLPVEQRVHPGGRPFRGPNWTEAEDYVVRKWFGMHTAGPHAGHHAPPTEAGWVSILAELNGNRRKTDIRRRVHQLNLRLRESLSIGGILSMDGVRRYQREALGERDIPVPRNRVKLRDLR